MQGKQIYELMEARVSAVQDPQIQGFIRQDVHRRGLAPHANGTPEFTQFTFNFGRRAGHTWAIQEFLSHHPDAICVVRNKDLMGRFPLHLRQRGQVWSEYHFDKILGLYGEFQRVDDRGYPTPTSWVIYDNWMDGHSVRNRVKEYLDWHPSMRIQ